MGFDIIGIKPINDSGKSFSRNIQGWTPLWNFICQYCADLLTKGQAEEGFANDGIKISAKQTKLIVERLENFTNPEEAVTSKPSELQLKETLNLHSKAKQKDPGISPKSINQNLRQDLSEFLEFARNSGGFKIY